MITAHNNQAPGKHRRSDTLFLLDNSGLKIDDNVFGESEACIFKGNPDISVASVRTEVAESYEGFTLRFRQKHQR